MHHAFTRRPFVGPVSSWFAIEALVAFGLVRSTPLSTGNSATSVLSTTIRECSKEVSASRQFGKASNSDCACLTSATCKNCAIHTEASWGSPFSSTRSQTLPEFQTERPHRQVVELVPRHEMTICCSFRQDGTPTRKSSRLWLVRRKVGILPNERFRV
jgi:hypothetical protein